MAGQINFTQVDSPTAPTTGITALSFPATSTNQLKWVDADGGTNIIAGGGFTLTVPATGTAALTGSTLAQFAATTSAQLAGVISDETGSGALVFATSPTLVTPVLGAASATSLAVPAITTASGALTVTPAAGSGMNVVLSGAGDFAVNTNDLYVDTSAGKVGIGTTTPEDLLTVSGGNLQVAHTAPRIYINDTDAPPDEGEYFFQSSAGGLTGYAINDARGAVSQWLGVTRSGVTVASVYFPTGNVGIGTTSPGSALEVNGDIEITAGQAIKPTADSTTALKLANAAGTAVVTVDTTNKNLAVGGSAVRATTAGVSAVNIFNGTAPVGTLTNGISIYSSSGECYIMDAAGNATLQSPHDSDTGEWIFYSRNTVTGRTVRVNMERMIQRLGEITGEQFWEEWSE